MESDDDGDNLFASALTSKPTTVNKKPQAKPEEVCMIACSTVCQDTVV